MAAREFIPLHTVRSTKIGLDGDRDLVDIYWDKLTYGDVDDTVDGVERIKTSLLRDRILHTNLADDIPASVITQLLISADVNCDGYIDRKEFSDLYRNTKRLPKFREALRESAFFVLPRSARDVHARRYIDEYTCWPPVVFMPLITLLEIGIFIYYAVTMGDPVTASGPCPLYSVFIYNPQRRYEAWRYLTYMLIHSGWVHLVNNLVIQLILGVVLEMVHHWWRIMLVYLIGVIGGSLASSIASPNSFLAGASGGVYAVEYAYLGNLILNWGEMKHPVVQLLGVLTFSFIDVGYAIFDTYFSDMPSNTGHMAHLGGALTGVLVGVNVLRNLTVEDWEKYAWWAAFCLLSGLFIAAITVNIVSPEGFFPDSDFTSISDMPKNNFDFDIL